MLISKTQLKAKKLFSREGNQPFENMYFLRSRMSKSDFFLLDVDGSGKQRHCYNGNDDSQNKHEQENLTWCQSFRMFPLNCKFRSTITLDAMLILIPRGYLRIYSLLVTRPSMRFKETPLFKATRLSRSREGEQQRRKVTFEIMSNIYIQEPPTNGKVG